MMSSMIDSEVFSRRRAGADRKDEVAVPDHRTPYCTAPSGITPAAWGRSAVCWSATGQAPRPRRKQDCGHDDGKIAEDEAADNRALTFPRGAILPCDARCMKSRMMGCSDVSRSCCGAPCPIAVPDSVSKHTPSSQMPNKLGSSWLTSCSEAVAELQNEVIKPPRHDRIEPRRRLVEEQNVRV